MFLSLFMKNFIAIRSVNIIKTIRSIIYDTGYLLLLIISQFRQICSLHTTDSVCMITTTVIRIDLIIHTYIHMLNTYIFIRAGTQQHGMPLPL